ncbi:MAG TPA: 3-oxoacyl-ACP reductase [Paenalcaligenes sp.]|nr:3-oxoacyl-ACP reductase [Paenalcaligenes sp.]
MSENRIDFTQQVVLITGAARGLGRALSLAFAGEGARVIINYYQSKGAAEKLAKEIGNNAIALQADVREPQAVQHLVTQAQIHFNAPITTLVNNALPEFKFDGDDRATAEQIGWQSIEQQMGGVQSAINAIQAVLPGMVDLNFGRIINIGTNLVQNPVVPYHDYIAAKSALLALTRTFAHDLGPKGVTVNMISGGLLRTTDASAATPETVFDLIAANTPLQRVTTPAELADTALFFASHWARAVTGQNLIVDGGLVKQ